MFHRPFSLAQYNPANSIFNYPEKLIRFPYSSLGLGEWQLVWGNPELLSTVLSDINKSATSTRALVVSHSHRDR
jgi:hypothetical protein